METRKIIIILSAALLLFVTSCTDNRELRSFVRSFNKQCPISINDYWGEVTGAELYGNDITINCLVNEDYYKTDAMKNNELVLKKNMKIILSNPCNGYSKLIDILITNEGDLTWLYIGKTSNDSVSVTLSCDELKELNSTVYNPERIIEAAITNVSMHLPQQIDEMIVCTKMVRDGNMVVYDFELDENVFDISVLEANRFEYLASLIYDIQQRRGVDPFLKACYDANVDIMYCYHGSKSGDVAVFNIAIVDIFEK